MGRRADGYHLLESLFVPLELADEVTVSWTPDVSASVTLHLEGESRGVPGNGRNLAVRAAWCFLKAAGLSGSVSLRLEKRVPPAAGLGGGSSDAGAVLRALAQLHPGLLDSAALAELALDLGADVPFFLAPCPAWIEGVGERIEPVPGLPALPVLLVHPGVPLSTAEVYGAWDGARDGLTGEGPRPTIETIAGLFRAGWEAEPSLLAGLLVNDLEPAATRLCPRLSELRDRLGGAGAIAVGLSGSGPTLYGIFAGVEAAQKASRRDWGGAEIRVWLTRSVASSLPAQ